MGVDMTVRSKARYLDEKYSKRHRFRGVKFTWCWLIKTLIELFERVVDFLLLAK